MSQRLLHMPPPPLAFISCQRKIVFVVYVNILVGHLIAKVFDLFAVKITNVIFFPNVQANDIQCPLICRISEERREREKTWRRTRG